MSNAEYILCDCGARMYRLRAQTSKGPLEMGYSCPACGCIQDKNRVYLIPITTITDCDPYLKTAKPREAYEVILKSAAEHKDRAVYVRPEQIDKARDVMIRVLDPFCRPKIEGEKIPRLDRGKFKKDLEKDEGKSFPKIQEELSGGLDEILQPLSKPIPGDRP